MLRWSYVVINRKVLNSQMHEQLRVDTSKYTIISSMNRPEKAKPGSLE